MRLLSLLFDGVVGLIGSFVGVMSASDLAAAAAAGRRWLARLGRAIWPDVRNVPDPRRSGAAAGPPPGPTVEQADDDR